MSNNPFGENDNIYSILKDIQDRLKRVESKLDVMLNKKNPFGYINPRPDFFVYPPNKVRDPDLVRPKIPKPEFINPKFPKTTFTNNLGT